MIKTRLTELTGIDHPIICGTMHALTGPEMVAAVANAGALGILYTTGYRSAAELRDALQRTKSLTGRPFGANINLFPGTRPADVEAFIDTMGSEGVRVIETSGRNPKDYVDRIKQSGAVFMHKVARVRDGITAAHLGVDIIEIVGYESGGHPGEEDVGLLVQAQSLVHAVEVPVIPGGGVVDGRGLLAMLALGAEGVCVGTRFMATKECPVRDDVKRWILGALATDTVLVGRAARNSMRVARPPRTGPAGEGPAAEVADTDVATAGAIGRVCMGQTVGLINDIPTVRELVERTVREAEDSCRRLHPMFEPR